MAKISKRMKVARDKINPLKQYTFEEVVAILGEIPKAKFEESVDVAIQLGVDPRKSDQVVRSASVLPHGTGKKVRVAVFAQGAKADEAKAAGADIVGFDDLADAILGGQMDFDVVVASPDAMRVVGRLGQVLGPRGLMPNPKVGTVTPDVATAVRNAKGGQVRYRTDKAGIVHCSIGKSGFSALALKENLECLLSDLKKIKPASAKGTYLGKVSLSTTMGPSFTIDLSSLAA